MILSLSRLKAIENRFYNYKCSDVPCNQESADIVAIDNFELVLDAAIKLSEKKEKR